MGTGNHTRQAPPILTVRLKILDSGSTAIFGTMKIARGLRLEGRKTAMNLTTIGQHRTENCSILHDLEVSDLDDGHTI